MLYMRRNAKKCNNNKKKCMFHVNIIWSYLCTVIGSVYIRVIYTPVKNIYLYGPRAFGMWEGMTIENICTHLVPRSRAEFWLSNDHNMKECFEIVEKNIHSWVIVIEYTAILCLLVFLYTLISRWWWHRRMVIDMSHIIEKLMYKDSKCHYCTTYNKNNSFVY